MADHGEFEAQTRGLRQEEIMRNLDEDARAVAGIRFAATSATMVKIYQNFQGVRHHLMGFLSLHVYDETKPASVVFELRIVKPLFWRSAEAHRTGLISCRHCFQVMAGWISPRSAIFYLKFYRAQ